MHVNIEFKARCSNPDKIRNILSESGADYKGKDHQVDVYFNVENGRLKLRKGKIENKLIYYERSDKEGPKQSDVILFSTEPGTELELLLTKCLGVKVIVDKQRDIYFIENVKFHVDEVSGLGSFVEVEAIDIDGSIGKDKLQAQCEKYLNLFGIADEDMVAVSYSDLLMG